MKPCVMTATLWSYYTRPQKSNKYFTLQQPNSKIGQFEYDSPHPQALLKILQVAKRAMY